MYITPLGNHLKVTHLHGHHPLRTGVQYEAALRKQHKILNPRTDWAARDHTKAAKRLRLGQGEDRYGEGSEDEAARGTAAGDDVGEGSVAALLQQAGGLLGPTRMGLRGRLPPGSLETSRMKDANQHDPHDSVVRSVEFHPGGQLLMTAGLDKRVRLFQVRTRPSLEIPI